MERFRLHRLYFAYKVCCCAARKLPMCKARYAHCLLTVCLVFSEQDGPAGVTGMSKDACMQNRAYVRELSQFFQFGVKRK